MRTVHLNQPLIVGILTAEESEDTSPRPGSSSDSDYGVFITYGATGILRNKALVSTTFGLYFCVYYDIHS